MNSTNTRLSTAPMMQHGNVSRIHTHGDIAALKFADETVQYDYGARWVRALIGVPWRDSAAVLERGLAMSDMAVLVRTRKQMMPIAAALRGAGLSVLARGEQSLLVPPEAEALATVFDYLAGQRIDPPARGGLPPVVSNVSAADVKRKAIAARLAETEASADAGLRNLNDLMESSKWQRGSVCLIEVIEDYLCALGYHAAFDGESELYPLSPAKARQQVSPSGELAWYAVARILNAAADYQRIFFRERLERKIKGFAAWLRLEAPVVYRGDERAEDDGLRVCPDAVNLLTAHSAKGLEWPVVWVPDLAFGRFPHWQRRDGSEIWNILPQRALTHDQGRRADGEIADEHRLAYVAITRFSQYLLATYAPPATSRKSRPSPYFNTLKDHKNVVTNKRDISPAARKGAHRLTPSPRRETKSIRVTYSQLFLYWICPRAFYLRFVLGFPPPIAEELGYGQSLHNAAREVHERVRNGEHLTVNDLNETALRHFHLPFADDELTSGLRAAAVRALVAYHKGYRVEENGRVAYVEQEIRCDLGAIILVGRIDLARVVENGDIVLSELKTEGVSDTDELIAQALGFEAGTGQLPAAVETRTLRLSVLKDKEAVERAPTVVNSENLERVRKRIQTAGDDITRGSFPMLDNKEGAELVCGGCDVRRVCPRGQAVQASQSSAQV